MSDYMARVVYPHGEPAMSASTEFLLRRGPYAKLMMIVYGRAVAVYVCVVLSPLPE